MFFDSLVPGPFLCNFPPNAVLDRMKRMNDPDEADPDAALMLRVKQGDVGAFSELVTRWQQPVMNFLCRLVPDPTEAEDLAQSVFVQVWKAAGRYRQTARFSTFLFTIARNLGLNEIRRRNRHPAEPLDPRPTGDDDAPLRPLPDPNQLGADIQMQQAELVTKVDEALADLPEKQRLALALCREGELSYEEIAVVLECTIPATKSLIHRARETLKSRLKPYLASGAWTDR